MLLFTLQLKHLNYSEPFQITLLPINPSHIISSMQTNSPTHREYLQDISSDESDLQEIRIFDHDFEVQALQDPNQFLTKYQQSRAVEPTANEQCLTCCGSICMACAPPFALCCCNCCCLYQLPTSKAGLVEAFGKFTRLLKPGLNIINPCSEEVREVDLRLKGMQAGRHPTITKDQVKVDIDASLSFRVVNPIISYYVLGMNLNRALIELTVSSLREVVGQYNLEELLVQRFEVAIRARDLVVAGIPPGIKVHNVFVEEIVIPPQTERDLTAAARQKRLSEATIISNKADVQSAALMRESARLLDNKAAMQIRYLQMVKQLGQKGVVIMMDIGADKKGYS